MKVIDEVEHEDGSATYTFEMTDEERRIMVEQGLLWSIVAGATGITVEEVLRDYIDQKEEDDLNNGWTGQ